MATHSAFWLQAYAAAFSELAIETGIGMDKARATSLAEYAAQVATLAENMLPIIDAMAAS